MQMLVTALANRRMLLVLDNCEHLLEPLSIVVERLLEGAPELRVLATSQEPLRVHAEQQLRLEPLAIPREASAPGARAYGALVLFESRVRAAAPYFELRDADLPLAIDICRQLDGLPLAIELAAARVPLLGLRSVQSRLHERFLLLTAGTRTALRRHQTLHAAMDWSHSLLDEPQRTVFRRIGVFSGGFTMELAQAVCADDELDGWAVLDQLAALIDKSLVVVANVEPVRYHLLESARAFALEQLAAAEETAALVRGHAEVMLALLRSADDGKMDSTLRTDHYAALVLPELDNLRAAYRWATGESGDRALGIGLAAHAGPLIDYSTEFAEWLIAQEPHLGPGLVDDATAARYWRAMAASNMVGPRRLPELLDAAQRAADAYRAMRLPRTHRPGDPARRLPAPVPQRRDRTAAAAGAIGIINPARLLGLPSGRLEKGAPADLILVDLGQPWVVDRTLLKARSKNSPFDESRMQGRVLTTMVAGNAVYQYAAADRA